MANGNAPKTYNWLWFAIIGFLFGLVAIIVAVFIALSSQGLTITFDNVVNELSTNPLLWLFMVIPFILALLLGYIGYKEDQLAQLRYQQSLLNHRAHAEVQKLRAQQVLVEELLEEKSGVVQQSVSDLEEYEAKYSDAEQRFQQTEQLIGRGKRQWEATFDAVQDLIIITDENKIVVRCNQATPRAFHTDYAGILGKEIGELLGSEVETDMFLSQKVETRFSTLDGWYEITGHPLQLDEGQFGNIFVVRNVSERKHASLELQLQKQYYEALFRNSPVAIVTLKQDQTVMDCNPAFEQLFGYSLKEIRGSALDHLIASEKYNEEAKALTELVAQGDMVRTITERMRRDGSPVEVEVFGIPVVVAGKQLGVLGMYHDLSGLQPVEEQVDEPVTVAEKPKPAEKPAYKVNAIEGIGPVYAEKLGAVGIITTEDLLDKAGSRKGREELAEMTGISYTFILAWVNRADLMRIPGVGEEYSDLLEAAGVDTVKELRNRNPENLHNTMHETNQEKHLVRREPSLTEVQAWVGAAKQIEPRVTY